jgi:hypothetical protein
MLLQVLRSESGTKLPTSALQRFGRAYFRRVDRSRGLPPNIDLHHFIERDAVLAPIVELRRSRRRMRRHLARFFQRAAILEVGRDAGAAEGVVADFRGDAGRLWRAGAPSSRR